MREAFSDQIDALRSDLAVICGTVRTAVENSTRALLTADAALAERVISADVDIDRAREVIEERTFALISLQAPVAGDLRALVAALRMVGELERMGDLAVHVAKIARLRVPERAVPESLIPTISRMAEVAEDMVGQVVTIIRENNVLAAQELEHDEQELDLLRRSLFRLLLASDWGHGVEAAVDGALLGRYYERIGDHALSVAQRVVFVVTGQAVTAE